MQWREADIWNSIDPAEWPSNSEDVVRLACWCTEHAGDTSSKAVAVRQPSAEQFLQAIAAAVGGTSQNSQKRSDVRLAERLYLTVGEAANTRVWASVISAGRLPRES